MTYIEAMLLRYLKESKLKMEITGFDVKEFEKALRQEARYRLEEIAEIIYEDDDLMSDAEKVTAVRELLGREYFNKD